MAHPRASARCSTCRSRVRASASRSQPIRPTSGAASACSNSSTSAIASSRRRSGSAPAVSPEGGEEFGMSEPLVIIGNGMSAARFADELSKRALGRYAVAVVGDEPRLAYNRVLLSSLLAGEIASSQIELKPSAWWRDRGITLRYGCRATGIDMAARTVALADGQSLAFSKLVFATGSQPIRPAIPGMALPGVITFRDVADIWTIWHRAGSGDRVVVIGGGLLGLEAAYGLAKAGARVTVLHLMDRLIERQLDAQAARMLQCSVEDMG